MKPEEWEARLATIDTEELHQLLDSGRMSEGKARDARAELAKRQRQALADQGTFVFPVPPRSRFKLSENTKATIVLIAQIVASAATVALAVIGYLTWVSPHAPK